MKEIVLIGYSGHAFVIADCAIDSGRVLKAYHERDEKVINPYQLEFWGEELIDIVNPEYDYFVAIGDNKLREKISENLKIKLTSIISNSAYISPMSKIGMGVLIGPRSVINSKTTIGDGVICNSGSVIEHQCTIDSYAHIAPGVTLCGNVKVGRNTLIGANATVLPGISIGDNCIIGAGSVVTKNIPNNSVSFGNPIQLK